MNTDKLREYCLSFPGTTEGIKWEDHLCFMVADKIFLITGMDDQSQVTLKVRDEEYVTLIEKDGIIPAPYLARNKWVGIEKRNALSQSEWKKFIQLSYDIIKSKLSKKTQMSLKSKQPS
jgi:predicted DNA-binding protein (MmcQ/YjbR family)